jgi:transcriptional regulator EpsA
MSEELPKADSTSLAVRLAKALEAASRIRTKDEFHAWAERDLWQLIPHQLLICGQLEFGRTGASMRPLIRHEYECATAPQYTEEVRLLLPLVRGWARSAKPQLLREQPSAIHMSGEQGPLCLPTPIILHGLADTSGKGASYIALCGLDPQVNFRQGKLLELLVPHMHLVLTALLRRERAKPAVLDAAAQPPNALTMPRVSQREREVLQWLQEGKTNWEIAQILGKSEHTVKNQVRSLLVKLRVNNRAQAVAKMAGMEMA